MTLEGGGAIELSEYERSSPVRICLQSVHRNAATSVVELSENELVVRLSESTKNRCSGEEYCTSAEKLSEMSIVLPSETIGDRNGHSQILWHERSSALGIFQI